MTHLSTLGFGLYICDDMTLLPVSSQLDLGLYVYDDMTFLPVPSHLDLDSMSTTT